MTTKRRNYKTTNHPHNYARTQVFNIIEKSNQSQREEEIIDCLEVPDPWSTKQDQSEEHEDRNEPLAVPNYQEYTQKQAVIDALLDWDRDLIRGKLEAMTLEELKSFLAKTKNANYSVQDGNTSNNDEDDNSPLELPDPWKK